VSAVLRREKLAAVLARLESPYEGERAAAGLIASRMIREAGLTWQELLEPEPPPLPPPPKAEQLHWRDMIAICRRRPELLSQWEWGFLKSLAGFSRLSSKQLEVLGRLTEKVLAG
jgi:hypothetical protein